MRAIVNTGPGKLEMREVSKPLPGRGQVRIRTGACAICATDLAMIAGWERTPFGSIPGHEWAGTVDAAGEGVDSSLVGRRCVAENVWTSDGGEVGFEHPGGYAEYFVTEAANVHVLPDDFDLTAAALIEPLAVCVRAVKRLARAASILEVRGSELGRTLIMGDGPIGLLMTAILRTGVLVGGRQHRLMLARELGADSTINYHDLTPGNPADGIRRARRGVFPEMAEFQTIIEASGSDAAMQASLDLAAVGARVLVIGDYGAARAGFPWNRILHRELELIGSNASAGAWGEAVALATRVGTVPPSGTVPLSGTVPSFSGPPKGNNRGQSQTAGLSPLPLARLVSHVLPAERFAEGVEMTRSKHAGVIKVVLRWE
ncbi:MAG: zinc-binding dehydrogenase [Phycisphaerae bacterium]